MVSDNENDSAGPHDTAVDRNGGHGSAEATSTRKSVVPTGCRATLACGKLEPGAVLTVAGGGGAADCPTIQSAVNCAPPHSKILIAPGVYREQVVLNTTGVQLLGQAPMAAQASAFDLPSSAVVVTWSTPNLPVLNVTHDDCVIANVTAYNDANRFQVGKQSALYVTSGDRTAAYFSSFFGAQDTVYTGQQRTYLFGCRVNGTTDFNYGQGAAVFDECVLVGERAGNFYNGESFLTAATGNVSGTGTPNNPQARAAYLVRNSRLPASPRIGKTYLGRPWGDGATVVYDNVWMDAHIAPAGWTPQNNWRRTPCEPNMTVCADTFYAEHNSTGPGSGAEARVKWSHQLTAEQAAQWAPVHVLRGWVPPAPHTFMSD